MFPKFIATKLLRTDRFSPSGHFTTALKIMTVQNADPKSKLEVEAKQMLYSI